jgi:hypothetical protein
MNKSIRNLLAFGVIVTVTSCAAPIAYIAGGAVAGAWAFDQNEDGSGVVVLPERPETVFAAAQRVAHRRGQNVVATRGSMRIEFSCDEADVIMQVLMVPDRRDVAQLKVRARELIRGRADLAADLAASVEAEL